MTCIAALKHPKLGIFMGADSAGSSGNDLTLRSDKKVFKNGEMLIGCTSSFRMLDLLKYKLVVPGPQLSMSNHEYMATQFVDEVRKVFKDGGFLKKEKEEELGGTFIVGYRDEIFCIDSDFQVECPLDNFFACGCG